MATVRLFEAGHVYEQVGERTEERKRISLGATGDAEQGSVHNQARPYTFFDMKGDIEQLLERLRAPLALLRRAHGRDTFIPAARRAW